MSFIHVIGFSFKLGNFLLMLCWCLVSIISMKWLYNGRIMISKTDLFASGGLLWVSLWDKIKIHSLYSPSFGAKRVRRIWRRKFMLVWILFFTLFSSSIFHYMSSQAREKRKESLASMCDERARMLQDQFNVSMNHIQAMSIMISTFYHGQKPPAIDQSIFARYTEKTAFERPLTSGVAYAVKVLHSEREQFEKEQGWTIKRMDTLEQTPVHEDQYNPEALETSPIQDEYAPVIFAQETIAHVVSMDVLSGKEDRENVLRARASGKGVLTAPFRLIKTNRLGVILTFAVYRRDLPSNATPAERIEEADGYLGGVFDIESLVEKLLQQLASKQTILVNVYDTSNVSTPISMYGSNVTDNGLLHVSTLNFGDPHRKHEMHCRFKQKAPWPLPAMISSGGLFVITMLIGYIIHATINRMVKFEDDYEKMTVLKKRAEAADVAKSQFLATVSHEIRTPMNGVLGMLHMLMDTDMDETQQDYVRTAQASGKALVSLINEVLDQAKIESGKLELEAVCFDLRAILDDVLSLFSGKSQEKGVELAVLVSDKVPETLIGDPGRFRQIITNLMGNSIKFTEKGHIFVTVYLVEEVVELNEGHGESSTDSTLSGLPVVDKRQSWVGFKALCQDSLTSSYPSSSPGEVNLIVSVEDTGIGIPADAQSQIFTPFMQVGPSIARIHGGTGIGLSISKCLVQLMKGEINFVSEPKVGSTFTFTAVCTSGSNNSNEQRTRSSSVSSEFKSMRALVVDSRPVRAEVTKYHIQRVGIHVQIASDFDQGFSVVTTSIKSINMVFVEEEVWNKDVIVSGEFVSKLRRHYNSEAPKLFLLSNSVNSTKTRMVDSLVTMPFVIMKPLRASMLAASLQRSMGICNKGNRKSGELLSAPLHSLLLGRKILVVDDNIVNLKVAAGALRKYGADVVCAENGKKAISLLEPPHQFDACFMDIQMPEIDGFQATERIREMELGTNNKIQHGDVATEAYGNVSNWHVPILAMTADVMHATNDECLRHGMDGYVSKPFEAEQLYSEVSRFFPSESS